MDVKTIDREVLERAFLAFINLTVYELPIEANFVLVPRAQIHEFLDYMTEEISKPPPEPVKKIRDTTDGPVERTPPGRPRTLEARIVILHLASQGLAVTDIVAELKKRGLKNTLNEDYSYQAVYKLLRS